MCKFKKLFLLQLVVLLAEVKESEGKGEEPDPRDPNGCVVRPGGGDEALKFVVPVGANRRRLFEMDVRQARSLEVQNPLKDPVHVRRLDVPRLVFTLRFACCRGEDY